MCCTYSPTTLCMAHSLTENDDFYQEKLSRLRDYVILNASIFFASSKSAFVRPFASSVVSVTFTVP